MVFFPPVLLTLLQLLSRMNSAVNFHIIHQAATMLSSCWSLLCTHPWHRCCWDFSLRPWQTPAPEVAHPNCPVAEPNGTVPIPFERGHHPLGDCHMQDTCMPWLQNNKTSIPLYQTPALSEHKLPTLHPCELPHLLFHNFKAWFYTLL